MTLIIQNGNEKIYEGSDIFNEETLMVGDIISFDGTYFGRDTDRECKQQYVIKQREFKTYKTWNQLYGNQKMILHVEKYVHNDEWNNI